MSWFFLAAAVAFEICGTLSLRMASTGNKTWFIGVAAGYLTAFSMLALTLSAGMPLGIAYGIWAAAGIAITAVLSKLLFKEPLTLIMTVGIALIIGGVLLIETGSTHA